jgi:hypothetical protein
MKLIEWSLLPRIPFILLPRHLKDYCPQSFGKDLGNVLPSSEGASKCVFSCLLVCGHLTQQWDFPLSSTPFLSIIN